MSASRCPGSYLPDSKAQKRGPRRALCPECEAVVDVVDLSGEKLLQRHAPAVERDSALRVTARGHAKTFVDPGHP